uniref:Uncharacterized protein n=1 Tax=Arundo donax TaxID=35708 RepID=A0A0A9APZ1_ARUDO
MLYTLLGKGLKEKLLVFFQEGP